MNISNNELKKRNIELTERKRVMLDTIKRLRAENNILKNKVESVKNSLFEEFIDYSINRSIKDQYNKEESYVTPWGEKFYKGTKEYNLIMHGNFEGD